MENDINLFRWWDANKVALPLLKKIRNHNSIKRAEIAGSLRRGMELVHNINIIVSTENVESFRNWFLSQPEIEEVISSEQTDLKVKIFNFLVEIKIVSPQRFSLELIHFTGSKEHNQQLRRLKLEENKNYRTEASVYKSLGMQYIPPELRENRGEIEDALQGKLPKLIEYEDIRGTFHVHTTESDGRDSLETMVKAADNLGWEYLGISDHSKSCVKGNGLNEERLLTQMELLQKINQSKQYKIHLFSGVECDILKDGSLDFSNDLLKKLDFVVVSVHSSLDLDKDSMTKRMIRAAENPYTTIFGHISGRLLLRQEPYAFDAQKVIDACIANGKIIELNSNPKRLDMDWRYWHKAAEKGLICSIDPDAHDAKSLRFVEMGVKFARKGWLEKKHIFNSYPIAKVKKILNKTK